MLRERDQDSHQDSPPDFDRLWDYNQPEVSETRFRSLLDAARASGNPDYLAQLLTQIARAQGLQRQFDAAHRTLDEVQGMRGLGPTTARIRFLLERGRVFNSSREPERARPLFLEAFDLATAAGEDFHAVDAAHMMGIIEPPDRALEWNERAIRLAEQSPSERARGWLASLYNNVGWTYHGRGDFERALEIFDKALALRIEKKQEPQIRVARWCVARTLRSLGRTTEALERQRLLLAELEAIGEEDGFVFEEIGECLLAAGKAAEARPHFARAHEILSRDPGLKETEPERLARLRELGGGN